MAQVRSSGDISQLLLQGQSVSHCKTFGVVVEVDIDCLDILSQPRDLARPIAQFLIGVAAPVHR